MTKARPTVLQLCPFSADLEAGLAERFEPIRWFELALADQRAWLERYRRSVEAVVSGGHVGCSGELIEALPSLRIIAISGVGVDKVDIACANARGITVTTTPGAPTDDTADLAVGLVIALLRGIPAGDRHVRTGLWPQGELPLASKVTGRRFGIVGLGQIGSAVAARLSPFGPVAYTGPNRKEGVYSYYPDLSALARDSDVLIVTCPATADTYRMIDAGVLAALGSDAWLVNVSRGSIVDEAALIEALDAGRIAGAALDVFESEPEVSEALRLHPRVVLTPHIGSATVETRRRMAEQVLENLDAHFRTGLAGKNRPFTAGE